MTDELKDQPRDGPPKDESPKDALSQLDATAQAALVASGEVTESELTEAAIARVERLNPTLNAVIHPLFEKARKTCADGVADGPFRGVPFLVKDAVCHTEGDPFHVGMRFLKDRNFVATSDTELARRFRAAGFVFVGKTNTPELATSVTTEPIAYGATRNPWQLDTSTGGSSGGSAAAVAAGLVPVAHANDMGGSIRVPASFCGLVGLKPTRARSSLGPHFGEFWGPLTHEHVVTRSVRDSAAILDAIAGPAPGDPYSAPPPVRPWLEEVTRDSPPLRIGLLERGAISVHDDCQAATQAAASALESLGHHIEPVSIPCLAHTNAGPWIQAGLARDLDRWSETLGEPIGQDDVEPMNWVLAESGRRMNAAQYIAEAEAAFTWAREIVQPWANGLDVLITPTSATPAAPLGHMSGDVPLEQLFPRLVTVTAFTMPFDVTGQPAISLPLYSNGAGMPIGIQLVAATAREDILFQLAGQLERATPWAGRLPGLHA